MTEKAAENVPRRGYNFCSQSEATPTQRGILIGTESIRNRISPCVSLFGVGVKRRVEIDEIDAGIWELFRVPQPAKVIAEIKPVRHLLDSA
jgi:hypothetical protein